MPRRRVFERLLTFRVPPGEWDRIEALRGDVRQGEFLRDLLTKGLDKLEHGRPARDDSTKKGPKP